MGFKKGDIVYCVDNKLIDVSIDKKYRVIHIRLDNHIIIYNDIDINMSYHKRRFISEKEYQISKRKEKIIKLKDGIQKRRHSLLC